MTTLEIKTDFDVCGSYNQSALVGEKCAVCDTTLSLILGDNFKFKLAHESGEVKVEEKEALSSQFGGVHECLDEQLKLFFLLRNMLHMQAPQISKLLQQSGGANLTEVLSLCVECERVLNTSWRIHLEGQVLAKQLKDKFTQSMKTSNDTQTSFNDGSMNNLVRKYLTDTVGNPSVDHDNEPNYIIPDDKPPPEKKMRGKGFKRKLDTSISHKGFYTLVNNYKKWACSCGSTFQKKSHYNRHMQNQNPTTRRSYPCSICGESLTSPIDLKRHIAHQHSKLRVQCDKCGALIAGKEPWYLKKHQKSKYCQLVALTISCQKNQSSN